MAAQVALKRQQAAEDAIALGLRACNETGGLPILTPGPLWGPGTVTLPESMRAERERERERERDREMDGEDKGKKYVYLFPP